MLVHFAVLADAPRRIRANEQKRRQVYRGDIVRRLPFALTGMDDPVPTIDFSPRGSTESPYDVQRADIDG